MKVFIDTNILISAAFSSTSPVAHAFRKAMRMPYRAIVCEQTLTEMSRVFQKKYPEKWEQLQSLAQILISSLEIVNIPRAAVEEEKLIRDETDRPLLRAAIASACDYFLTGDKDFLESEITYPRIISVRDFLAL